MADNVVQEMTAMATISSTRTSQAAAQSGSSVSPGSVVAGSLSTNDNDNNNSPCWKSPHAAPYNLEISSLASSDTIGQTIQQHAFQIPNDGWYGLCFGLRLNGDLLESGKYSLYLHSHEQTKRYSLPFKHELIEVHEDGPKVHDDGRLTSIDVGKLLFLTKDSWVLVVRNCWKDSNIQTTTSTSSTSTGGDYAKSGDAARRIRQSSQELLLQWGLVAVQNVRETERRETDHSQHIQGGDEERDGDDCSIKKQCVSLTKLGTMSRTHVICSTCSKAFTSIHGVLCHARAQHYPLSSVNVMWTKPLKIIHQDNVMAVVVKPQGMVVQGAAPSLMRSDLLLALLSSSDDDNDDNCKDDILRKPIPVHRLDSPTGGLLVIAKTFSAESALRQSFAKHVCRKRYRALVVGKLEPSEGECTASMGGKDAYTKYRVVKYARSCDAHTKDGFLTVVDLYPTTGRKHQLRKHMKALGHSIWGDVRYGQYTNHPTCTATESSWSSSSLLAGDAKTNPHARLCLWAMEISLPHPVTGVETTFSMDQEPEWLEQVVRHQEEEWSNNLLFRLVS
jgi:23S rRNA-/tRNA-specific pseudouridylate synthase